MADRYDDRYRGEDFRGGRWPGPGERGYSREERGFADRAGDEIRSWFGDEDAERRRRMDEQRHPREYGRGYDREYGYGRGPNYGYGQAYGRDYPREYEYGREPGREYGRDWDYGHRLGFDYERHPAGWQYRGVARERGDRWGAMGPATPFGIRDQPEYYPPWGYREYNDTGRYGPGSERTPGLEGHTGRGPRGYQRSDERIREDVCDRLADDPWVDASEVEVNVRGGEVTLTGTVRDRHDKRRTEDLIDSISGVREVHNNLRVGSGGWSGGTAIAGEKSTVKR